jgi:hypothetical protein
VVAAVPAPVQSEPATESAAKGEEAAPIPAIRRAVTDLELPSKEELYADLHEIMTDHARDTQEMAELLEAGKKKQISVCVPHSYDEGRDECLSV